MKTVNYNTASTMLTFALYIMKLENTIKSNIVYIPGDLHARLGEHEDSAEVFEELYHRNPENATYIESYVRAHGHCKSEIFDDFFHNSTPTRWLGRDGNIKFWHAPNST